jgi:probable addiction module antidote protein
MNKTTLASARKSDCKKLVADYSDELDFINQNYNPDNPESLINAISVVARVRGITKVAKQSGVSRDGLYKAFSARGNPSLTTVMRVLLSLGYTLKVIPRK